MEPERQGQLKLVMKAGSTYFESVSNFEDGRAEAIGALCSIFSSQSCGEPFLPIYLARFYRALAVGLYYNGNVRNLMCFCVYIYYVHTQS